MRQWLFSAILPDQPGETANQILRFILQEEFGHESKTKAHHQSDELRSLGRVSVLGSQCSGPLDHRLPVFGVRSHRPYDFLACDDNSIFSGLFAPIADAGEPAIAGAFCCSGNMDYRALHVDLQFEFLRRRTFSAGCLAVFCFRHAIVSAVHVSDVRLRWHLLRSVAYDIAASHPRELPRQRSRARVPVKDFLRCPKSAVMSRIAVYMDGKYRIPTSSFLGTPAASLRDLSEWQIHCANIRRSI
jgi:hypothetical protein